MSARSRRRSSRLRTLIGRILRWDEAKELVESVSFISRLNKEDRSRSLIVPGKPAGIARILYQFQNETLGEIINRTVHCFWLMATERTANGYALWFAVYVKKLNWFTPIYMALISPLVKWIIYPAMQRRQAAGTETGSEQNRKEKSEEGEK